VQAFSPQNGQRVTYSGATLFFFLLLAKVRGVILFNA
jgi:hypothetical protein